MGQYWYPVNLDKREFINPHRMGSGLKLWEQLANAPGTQAGLFVLTSAMPFPRGGGDFDLDENWHGPERQKNMKEYACSAAPMPEPYPAIAKRTIGRWAGDRIAIVGDYAEDGDIKLIQSRYKDESTYLDRYRGLDESKIYNLCVSEEYRVDYLQDNPRIRQDELWEDITEDVCTIIEHELGGKWVGEQGWRNWVRDAAEPCELSFSEDEIRSLLKQRALPIGVKRKLLGHMGYMQRCGLIKGKDFANYSMTGHLIQHLIQR